MISHARWTRLFFLIAAVVILTGGYTVAKADNVIIDGVTSTYGSIVEPVDQVNIQPTTATGNYPTGVNVNNGFDTATASTLATITSISTSFASTGSINRTTTGNYEGDVRSYSYVTTTRTFTATSATLPNGAPVQIVFTLKLDSNLITTINTSNGRHGVQSRSYFRAYDQTAGGTFSPYLMVVLDNNDNLHPGLQTASFYINTRVGNTLLAEGNTSLNGFSVLTGPGQGEISLSQTVTYDVTEAAPTPEPATLLLLGTGLAGVATKVGKRRKGEKHTGE